MKRIFVSIICLLLCAIFCGCSKSETSTAEAEDINSVIAYEIENLEGSENFEEETIKTLAVFYKSNLKNKKNIDYNHKHTNKHIYDIVKESTSEELEVDTEKTFTFNNNNNWQKRISKADILKFLSTKNISLASISDARPNIENDQITGIIIGETFVGLDEIISYFKLPSNTITNIEDKGTYIMLYGEYNNNSINIDISSINELAKSGKKHIEILKIYNNDFYLITNNK